MYKYAVLDRIRFLLYCFCWYFLDRIFYEFNENITVYVWFGNIFSRAILSRIIHNYFIPLLFKIVTHAESGLYRFTFAHVKRIYRVHSSRLSRKLSFTRLLITLHAYSDTTCVWYAWINTNASLRVATSHVAIGE